MVAKKDTAKSTAKKSTALTAKETVYVDVDDEITHIIDKVKGSNGKIVALVLPKRAAVLQSLVNMKLLKRSAVASKKNLVLITTEPGLMPLAGAAGIHVSKSLQTKPVIPASPGSVSEDEIEDLDNLNGLDGSESIGALAAATAKPDDEDVIEFDNIKTDDIDATPSRNAKSGKPKKNKKLKVPNFDKFRKRTIFAVLAVIILIVGWILAVIVLPRANIMIKTDSTSVVSSFDFTASTAQTSVDKDMMKIPALIKESNKTDTEKANATGERDEGTKAKGEVTLSVPCGSGFRTTVPSGTAVSSGDLNYITQDRAVLENPGGSGGSNCAFSDTVDVLAAENGDKFNISSGKSFTVAGFGSVSGRNSGGIDGGTSKIVKFVTQGDIDSAVSRITARQGDTLKDELGDDLEAENLFALKETFVSSDPKIQSTPALDQPATEFTVTYETKYSMLGVKRDDLSALINKDIEGEIDFEKQSIIDDGIDSAVMRINNAKPDQAFISFRSSVVAGPELNQDAIKEEIRGKKLGEVESYIKSLVGVQDVTVDYSPFWVYTTPKAAKKITITIEKPNDQNQDNSNSSDE